eukprot:TRINITY_DN17958_c0_g1_i1.p1 TRINITY_DN17958_c0_g1~~TRINITY_DN17958_c0_g1_i1.p1  ORF type:complete len:180 (+),score=49.00 TRINITY_DN17958_c0_g1_i1:35-541(+)
MTDINIEKDDELLEDVEEDEKKNSRSRKTKGRGFGQSSQKDQEDRYTGNQANFETLDDGSKSGPLKSIEGYIIFVTGVHEEATEDDLLDKFSEFGEVKNLQLPLDRRTGFVKGYALLEYATVEEAEAAIKGLDNKEFMDHTIHVDWAFSKGASKSRTSGRGNKRFTRH